MATGNPSALLVTIAVVLAAGCGPVRLAQPTLPMQPTLIVLLPDPESGITGRARVSNEFGAADLADPRASTRVTADGAPGSVSDMSEADVERLFADALAVLPPAPRHFTLQFQFESDALTEVDRLVLKSCRPSGASFPEVVVSGILHDGRCQTNLALGLSGQSSSRDSRQRRSRRGDHRSDSHGEADLLVKTPTTPEPRNRRVETTVK